MKRVYIILSLSLCAISLSAQHYFGISIGGLATAQFDNVDKTSSNWGGGGEIGAIYHFISDKFLLQTGMGIGLNSTISAFKFDNTMFLSANMTDTEGTPFTYKGEISNRLDITTVTELSVPLMAGYSFSLFYALAGAKFVYPITTTTCQTAELTTYGDYGMFYEDFSNMPQHGYVNNQPLKTIGRANFLCDLRLCLEFGGNLTLSEYDATQLTIGLFAEYGLLNTLKEGNNNWIDVDYSQYVNVTMNHIYTTLSRAEAIVNNLRIGVRATLLLPIGGVEAKYNYLKKKHGL